ncbi:MAG TPA: glycoside hydrolase family 27 protein [Flavitalea sp.]|nr:glycoside hydrolase family 27 protein [Flavitalea sp.]
MLNIIPSISLAIIICTGCNSSANEKNKSYVDVVTSMQPDDLAKTPPMGWNSWNAFGKNVSEEVIRQTADAFVTSGLKDAGFEYIVIDDLWQGGRDSSTGTLYADKKKFPSGIKSLADYVHSKGLKFGIYSDAGTKTCGDMPGSYGFEEKDAKLFASWGVDFLKYDYCYCPDYVSANNDYKMAFKRYKAMGDALRNTGRPIVFSICEWGPRSPWLWGKEAGGHMWRTSYDVADIWDSPRNETSPIGIVTSIDVIANLGRFAGPGGWNDPDMLVVGLNNSGFIKGGGCNAIEYATQMSMWCMFSAPLMIGCDVRNMSDDTKKILLDKNIIAIDQDPLGKQGFRVYSHNGLEAWKKPLSGGQFAIALFNRNDKNATLSVSLKDLEIENSAKYSRRDISQPVATAQPFQKLSADLLSHQTKTFILSRIND